MKKTARETEAISEGPRGRRARFWRKLLRLTRGRVPLLRALDVISEEETDSAFRRCIQSIRSAMEKGSTLSETMRGMPAEFSLSVVELAKTAEKTGDWDEIFQEIADGIQDGTFD
jgi:type II secretory pathway component PulF